jgi:hypothetical protein
MTADFTGARIDAANVIIDAGTIWVVHPKGRDGVAYSTIFRCARALGLSNVTVTRVSTTHTAEKFVIPRAARP